MAKLTTKERNKLPASDFAGPNRTFPDQDIEHGRKAVQLAERSVHAGNISEAEAERIKNAVHRKYPSIQINGKDHPMSHS